MKRILCLLFVVTISGQALGQLDYWTSARDLQGPNQLHLFDGPDYIRSVDQIPGAAGDGWGYRDGAADRAGHMYFGWGGGVGRHDFDGSNGMLLFDGANAPGGTYRALAFDPTGDGGSGSLWSASFGSELVEVDLSGGLLNSFPNLDNWSLYGLAYDDADGNLWGHSAVGGDVIKIDIQDGSPSQGHVIPGVGWPSAFPGLATYGGLSGVHDGTGRIGAIALFQSGVYDTSGNLVLGPWDLPFDGHLGIAVVPEPATFSLLVLGAISFGRVSRRW